MTKHRSKMQPQTSSPTRKNPGDETEENGRHILDISEMTAIKMKKEISEATDQK